MLGLAELPATAGAPPPARAVCAHCGLDVPSASAAEEGSDAQPQFCCGGCRAAHALLQASGLDAFYTLPDRVATPVAETTRTYDELDHPDFQELQVRADAGGLSHVQLVVEGVQCASCVWLVERLPLVVPDVVHAELDVRRAVVTLSWNARAVPLSRIARALATLGYPPQPVRHRAAEEARRREERAVLVRVGVAAALAINVMLAAVATYAGAFAGGLEGQFDRYFRWLSLALAATSVLGPGQVFFRGAWSALRTRSLHLDLPVAIALAAGLAGGGVNTVRGQGPVYFDAIAILVFLLLVGRFLQQRWQRAALDASELLLSVTPNVCRVVGGDGASHETPVSTLVPGVLLDVRAGETFAADGVVEAGASTANLAWLTGESQPVRVEVGHEVLAGTLNVSAPVRVRVSRAGEQTRVARVLRQAEESARRRAPVVLLANRLAGVFVGVVLVLAAATFILWLPRDAGAGLNHAIALLVVTCPCALAMATPLTVTVALGRAARRGIVVRGGDVLQQLADRRGGRVFLDKTGTVTEGSLALASWSGPEWAKPYVLALEDGSLHPVAHALRSAWPEVPPARAGQMRHVAGGGVCGVIDGRQVVVGSAAFVRSAGLQGTKEFEIEDSMELTTAWVAVDDVLVGRAEFGDPVRPDSALAVKELRARGWRPMLLTGDNAGVARRVAVQAGLGGDEVVSEATPEVKQRVVEDARGAGTVVMVGDGVNDLAALAAAQVGIAVQGGAEAALASSDAYLTSPGIAAVVELVDGARRTMRAVRRNIAFSIAYNAVAIALAVSGRLSPVAAAILMPLSSITVLAGAWYSTTFRAPR
jgi:Cu2+-exporting ATPase